MLDLTPNYNGIDSWFTDVDDTVEKVQVERAHTHYAVVLTCLKANEICVIELHWHY